MFWEILVMSLVGAAIGWFTNYLAIKLIFRPLNPVRIPIIGLEFQGLIPKRKRDIATSIGKTVEEELLSVEELLGHVNSSENQRTIINNVRDGIVNIVDDKIPSIIPRRVRNSILRYTGEAIEKESKGFIERNMGKLLEEVADNVKVKDLVEEKINEFDLIELEEIILSLSSSELKYIEVLGGVLGFLIGLMQGILIKIMV